MTANADPIHTTDSDLDEKSTSTDNSPPITDETKTEEQKEQETTGEDWTEESVPEAPLSGQRLFKDALLGGFIVMTLGALYTWYRQGSDQVQGDTADKMTSIKAHIQHAMAANDSEVRKYHLEQAETAARLGLSHLGMYILVVCVSKKDISVRVSSMRVVFG